MRAVDEEAADMARRKSGISFSQPVRRRQGRNLELRLGNIL